MYQKFSLGYLHRTCCFIEFFSLLLHQSASEAEHTHTLTHSIRARHINKLWISKWRQRFISSAQRDRRHFHYSLCIPSDQEVKMPNAGDCMKHVLLTKERKRTEKKVFFQQPRKRNWYWKVFFLFLSTMSRGCRFSKNVSCWSHNMWFPKLIYSSYLILLSALGLDWGGQTTTKTKKSTTTMKKAIENIYSNKCTYIEHTVGQCACNCSSYEKKIGHKCKTRKEIWMRVKKAWKATTSRARF